MTAEGSAGAPRTAAQTRRERTAQRLRDLRECVQQQTDVAALWEGSYREAIDERDELRRILQPLLDRPFEPFGERSPFVRCRVCVTDSLDGWTTHAPTCPVLRRDALLGRLGDGATGAARPPAEGA